MADALKDKSPDEIADAFQRWLDRPLPLNFIRFSYEDNAKLAKGLFGTSSDDFDAFLLVIQSLRDGEASKELRAALDRLHVAMLNSLKERAAACKPRGRQAGSLPHFLDGIGNKPVQQLLTLAERKFPKRDRANLLRGIHRWRAEHFGQ
ncbi:MAG: hypothetical protein IH623_00150 [Verrucomicrobia bacterium]|nr:hypothetical protein [Verrucomicrobiota bacterium]